jgi:monothiol glutaredoxin
MDDQTRTKIQGTIDTNDVVLFMKGNPAAPRCGFSAQIVQILDSLGVDYASIDVLADSAIREGIKEFSDWPTIPQLYVRKEFVGGCDIVKEMYGSGELEEKLGMQAKEIAPPTITVTESAAKALRAAVASPDEGVRFEIGPRYDYGLSIGSEDPRDIIVEVAGLRLLLDRSTAQRADGSTIDYVDTPQGAAFRISNPKEPPRVKQLSPAELSRRLKAKDDLKLYDVRSEQEVELARIEGAELLDRAKQLEIMKLPKNTPLVFHCHTGSRSQQAAEFFLSQGFTEVYNLAGGIDAWSAEVDPSVPRY